MKTIDVAEIIEVGQRRANALLSAGYHLLGVEPVSWPGKKEIVGEKPMHYVHKDIRYVIARTADQEPFPPIEPRTSDEASARAA